MHGIVLAPWLAVDLGQAVTNQTALENRSRDECHSSYHSATLPKREKGGETYDWTQLSWDLGTFTWAPKS